MADYWSDNFEDNKLSQKNTLQHTMILIKLVKLLKYEIFTERLTQIDMARSIGQVNTSNISATQERVAQPLSQSCSNLNFRLTLYSLTGSPSRIIHFLEKPCLGSKFMVRMQYKSSCLICKLYLPCGPVGFWPEKLWVVSNSGRGPLFVLEIRG